MTAQLNESFMLLTADLQRRFQLQEDGLAEEDLAGFQTQSTDLVLLQLNVFARL